MVSATISRTDTAADLLQQLGGIPAQRVLLHPPPGTAKIDDVVALAERDKRLCELVNGTLVEKAMGYRESLLAGYLITALSNFVRPRNLGLLTGEAGMVQLLSNQVRIPDVAFFSWQRVPGGKVPAEPVPQLVPDLAVEVLSKANTEAEMARKCGEYFAAGVLVIWLVDPDTRTVAVHTRAAGPKVLGESHTLDGGDVLAGFSLPLKEMFAELDRSAG